MNPEEVTAHMAATFFLILLLILVTYLLWVFEGDVG